MSGIHERSADHLYTSYQDIKDERHFVHVGDFGAEAVRAPQDEAFFAWFTRLLLERCRIGSR